MLIWHILYTIGILGFFACVVGLRSSVDIKKHHRYHLSTLIGILCVYITCFSLNYTSSLERKSKKWSSNTEIRIKSVNGMEILRDTVYILTPKKHKK